MLTRSYTSFRLIGRRDANIAPGALRQWQHRLFESGVLHEHARPAT
jgi:hypothetical protein